MSIQLIPVDIASENEVNLSSINGQVLPQNEGGEAKSFPQLLGVFTGGDELDTKLALLEGVDILIPPLSDSDVSTEISLEQSLKDILPQLSIKGLGLSVISGDEKKIELLENSENTELNGVINLTGSSEAEQLTDGSIVSFSVDALDREPKIMSQSRPSSSGSISSSLSSNTQQQVGTHSGSQGFSGGGNSQSGQQSNQQTGQQQAQVLNQVVIQNSSKLEAQDQLLATQFKTALGDAEKSERLLGDLGVGLDRRAQLPLSMQSIGHSMRSPQWGQALGQRVMYMASQKIQEAKITLNPEKLGPVQIKISIDKDQHMHVSMTAQHHATREALENAIPRLKDLLDTLETNQVNVDVGRDKKFEEQESKGHNGAATPRGGVDLEASDSEAVSVVHQPDNLVDFYA